MALMIQSMVGPPPADAGVINVGLAMANARAARIMLPEPLTVTIREGPDGRVVAGLRGTFIADWLHATEMWVAEEDRGAGLGAEVMTEAESVAMRRRCVGVHLDAFDFQSPGFYERLGYEAFGVVEDHPRGGRRIYLQKRLVYPEG